MKPQPALFFGSATKNTIFPDYFTLAVSCNPNNTDITMQFFTKDVTTYGMLHLTQILETYLPTILESSCFNEQNLPFNEEVIHTELGHLFEHILLEYLCKEKINAGNKEAVFRGVTKWNWQKDTVGTFHIQVDVEVREKELLYFALEQSTLLLKRIIHYHNFLLPYSSLMKPSSLNSLVSSSEKQMV